MVYLIAGSGVESGLLLLVPRRILVFFVPFHVLLYPARSYLERFSVYGGSKTTQQ